MWHPEVIPPFAQDAISALNTVSPALPFYLAGGTGLALHFGHRRSYDLDFFSGETVDEEALLRDLQGLEGLTVLAKTRQTLELHLGETPVSFMGYPYPLLFATARYSGLEVADPRDIACMKLSAIQSRGTKRDFVDLYVASKQYPLADLIGLFERKFAALRYNIVHLMKSLTYFEDAEKDPPPDLLVGISWEEVKRFFAREVPGLL
ncbi:MAG: nucleotidyl transferase AbiEii/AbiGii toxin family protein [Acidobacteriota bacterium]